MIQVDRRDDTLKTFTREEILRDGGITLIRPDVPLDARSIRGIVEDDEGNRLENVRFLVREMSRSWRIPATFPEFHHSGKDGSFRLPAGPGRSYRIEWHIRADGSGKEDRWIRIGERKNLHAGAFETLVIPRKLLDAPPGLPDTFHELKER